MKVRIHRGSGEIGGSCIEVEAEGKRVVLDVGKPLWAERDEVIPLPSVDGLASGNDPSLLGLFITHGHQDHWGLVEQVSKNVPLFMGESSAAILREASFFTTAPQLNPKEYLKHRSELKLGPFRITPFLNDHSGFDTYSLLIEADDSRLMYSSDFQGHGRKRAIFEEFLRKPPRDVDVLLLEGTNVFGKGASKEPISEQQVEEECVRSFAGATGAILAIYSAQNIDRLVTLFRAAKRTERLFVIDLYTAAVARASGNPNIPQPDWEGVRVFVPLSQRIRVKESGEFERVRWVRDSRIFPEDLAGLASKLVLTFRTSMIRDLEKTKCLDGAVAIWSLWPGYLADEGETRLMDFLNLHQIPMKVHHASGHAYLEDLQRYALAVASRRLVPIHSAAPERFEELFDHVERHADGEWWEV